MILADVILSICGFSIKEAGDLTQNLKIFQLLALNNNPVIRFFQFFKPQCKQNQAYLSIKDVNKSDLILMEQGITDLSAVMDHLMKELVNNLQAH